MRKKQVNLPENNQKSYYSPVSMVFTQIITIFFQYFTKKTSPIPFIGVMEALRKFCTRRP
jgi:hypothetical protein